MKKRRNAFTLIELLAVIVVLAIIALIATPIVMKTINNARVGAAERSADNYIKAVETAIMEDRLNTGETIPDGEYQITGDTITNGNKTLTVEVSGNKPSSGSIVIKNGSVTKESSMTIGNYNVSYKDDKLVATEKGSTPEVEVLCRAVTELSTQYVTYQGNIQTGVLASEAGPYAYGVEYTCELGDNDKKTFYVLEENGDNVSLIMNMNIDSNGKGTTSGNTVAWASKEDYIAAGGTEKEYGYGNYDKGPVTALKYLKNSIANWTKLNQNQISMPTGEQIAKAGGDTVWNDGNLTGTVLSSWLSENLNDMSAPYGYWTSTPTAFSSTQAWQEYSSGPLLYSGVDTDSNYGVRPVITIPKSQLG